MTLYNNEVHKLVCVQSIFYVIFRCFWVKKTHIVRDNKTKHISVLINYKMFVFFFHISFQYIGQNIFFV